MDAFDCIFGRRSVRQYTAEPVSEEEIQKLMEAAMAAPSAGNSQPWHFVVVTDKELLGKIPAINHYAQMAAQAALAVLICGNPAEERFPGFWVQDCAAATQNILLAAHALGLGGVWTGVHPIAERAQALRELFNVPQEVEPLTLVILGRPTEQPQRKSRYNADKIHRERW